MEQWVFFTFFKLYKWYQIAQRTTFVSALNTPLKNLHQPWWYYERVVSRGFSDLLLIDVNKRNVIQARFK